MAQGPLDPVSLKLALVRHRDVGLSPHSHTISALWMSCLPSSPQSHICFACFVLPVPPPLSLSPQIALALPASFPAGFCPELTLAEGPPPSVFSQTASLTPSLRPLQQTLSFHNGFICLPFIALLTLVKRTLLEGLGKVALLTPRLSEADKVPGARLMLYVWNTQVGVFFTNWGRQAKG